MNFERYQDWVRVSFRWARDEESAYQVPHYVQTLGIVDAELRGIRKQDLFNPDGSPKEDEFGILKLEHYQIKAHLWVLGAYELVRMISQRVREDESLTTDASIEIIHNSKKQFERVRIPLAKLEASKRNKSDFNIAFAGIGPDGLAWKVADDCIISQEYLSDLLHQMMASIWPREYNHLIQPNADVSEADMTPAMKHDAPLAQLGHFVLTFQAVEAAMVDLAVQLIDADPEYIATLMAELEFNSKARALDVIYTRYAQIHGLSKGAPHPEFHNLMGRIQKLATRRNDLVHSFYGLLTTVDGAAALARQPTRLKPSKGLREQEGEDILPARLEDEIQEMRSILQELEKYRLQAIDIKYQVNEP